ncbi:hypothetical protein [Marinimicrobium sp. LS-A18]|uniref:hypothetical protein n=1 Tax=Marinimicrobium sp. LS-A18 TaxID=1381596 RepID=UPI0004B13079|nr:hypothetical protein [Marinimicrobium sp. LS-A18]
MSITSYIERHDNYIRNRSDEGVERNERVLVFSVNRFRGDQRVVVGGFADRLKGMCFSYLVALITNRLFFVEWNNPSDITSSFVPKLFGWDQLDDYDASVMKQVDWVDTNLDEQVKLALREGGESIEGLFGGERVVKVNSNQFPHSLLSDYSKLFSDYGIDWASYKGCFSGAFNSLFEYSPPEDKMKSFKAFGQFRESNVVVIGAQFRVGGTSGGWKDPQLEDVENAPMLAKAIETFASDRGYNKFGVYITTDNQDVKNILADYFLGKAEVFFFEERPTHLDRSTTEDAARGADQVYLEHTLLSLSDHVIVGKGGFGLTAAYRENKTPVKYTSLLD